MELFTLIFEWLASFSQEFRVLEDVIITTGLIVIATQIYKEKEVIKSSTKSTKKALISMVFIFVLCALNGYVWDIIHVMFDAHSLWWIRTLTMLPLIYFIVEFITSRQISVIIANITNERRITKLENEILQAQESISDIEEDSYDLDFQWPNDE